QLMVGLAPHLVRPLPFVVPAFDGARPDRMVGVGLNLYDAMARGGRRRDGHRSAKPTGLGAWEPERHRVIAGDEVVERLPTLVGTTDSEYDADDLDHVRPPDDDVDYLLGAVNAYFGAELGRADITGAYAGVRPLISTGDPRKSVDISRKAELYETSSGMITITGGKLTTWRRMAKMAVDRLVEREARTAPCRTHEVPLGQPIDAAELPRVEGVPQEAYERLAGRYGHTAHEVLAVAAESGELAQPIVAGGPADLLA